MYSYIVAKYKTMNHKRKRKIIKKRTKQPKNVMMRKSMLFLKKTRPQNVSMGPRTKRDLKVL